MRVYTAYLEPEEKRKALGRAGYYAHTARGGRRVDRWNVLNWFVTLARTDVEGLGAGDLLNLQNEYRALQEVGVGFIENPAPSREKLSDFRGKVRKKLDSLLDYGVSEFGPFELTISISRPKRRAKPDVAHQFKDEVYAGEWVEPTNGQGLLHVMGKLLKEKEFAGKVERCASDECQEPFLQSKRTQRYCSRACQSVAVMRGIRLQRKQSVTHK